MRQTLSIFRLLQQNSRKVDNCHWIIAAIIRTNDQFAVLPQLNSSDCTRNTVNFALEIEAAIRPIPRQSRRSGIVTIGS